MSFPDQFMDELEGILKGSAQGGAALFFVYYVSLG